MLNNKRTLAVILSFLLCFNSLTIVLADVAVVDENNGNKVVKSVDGVTKDNILDQIKKKPSTNNSESLQTTLTEESLPVGYDQSVIDDINNNSIGSNISENSVLSEQNVDGSSAEVSDGELQTLDTTSGMPDGFKVEPVNSPFNVKNNNNEAVSLSTGALTFKKSILSLPGRNGLDLNINIKYNSDDSVITKNEYDNEANIRNVQNLNQFCIGWSMGFTSIVKTKTMGPYGYKTVPNIRLADGSSYVIGNDYLDNETVTVDKILKLQNYLLNDLSLIRKADTKGYELTYSDGRKEYFDGTYGNITKIEDRYGNIITFEYDEMDYYQGSFSDYYLKTNYYSTKLNVLKKITDSIGRIINVGYTINNEIYGKRISEIYFELDNVRQATLKLERVKSYNGKIDVLNNVVDAENMSTSFEYKEELSNIYNSYSYSYTVNGSCFTLSKVNYPTGGWTVYEYEKGRRNYSYLMGNSRMVDWYETYKTIRRCDSSGYEIKYAYENDYSGYPFSYLRTESAGYTNPDGNIADNNVKFHTIVTQNGSTTIHTFDYKHTQISEQMYEENKSINSYMKSRGNSKWNVVVNNYIYSL